LGVGLLWSLKAPQKDLGALDQVVNQPLASVGDHKAFGEPQDFFPGVSVTGGLLGTISAQINHQPSAVLFLADNDPLGHTQESERGNLFSISEVRRTSPTHPENIKALGPI
jgi:hypothetical protein